jgi:hypothetical protein
MDLLDSVAMPPSSLVYQTVSQLLMSDFQQSYLQSRKKNQSTIKIISQQYWGRVRFMEFNATFNNISGITWRSVLLVEETGVPGENCRPVACH